MRPLSRPTALALGVPLALWFAWATSSEARQAALKAEDAAPRAKGAGRLGLPRLSENGAGITAIRPTTRGL